VHSFARNVPSQLLLALVEKGVWTHAQGLLYAHQISDAGEHARTLVRLAGSAPPAWQAPTRGEALAAVRALGPQEAVFAASALAALGFVEEAVRQARGMSTSKTRAAALAAVGARLSNPLQPAIIQALREIGSPAYCAEAMVRLVESAPAAEAELRSELLTEAFEACRQPAAGEEEIGASCARVAALAGLFPYLAEPRKAEAIELALHLSGGQRQLSGKIVFPDPLRLQVFAASLAKLGLAPDALDAALHHRQGETLAALAPYLSEPDLRRALKDARSLKDVNALAGVLPCLAELGHPDEAWSIARKLIVNINVGGFSMVDYDAWLSVISRLAPCLPAPQLRQALAAVPAIRDDAARSRALERLMGQTAYLTVLRSAFKAVLVGCVALWAWGRGGGFEPPLYISCLARIAAWGSPRLALRALRAIPDEHRRGQALQYIVPHLPEPLIEEALDVARQMEGWRWEALAAVARWLPEALAQQLFQEMTHAEDRHILSTEKVLATLIPRLGELGHVEQAYGALRDLEWDENRHAAMAGIALFLPGPSLREVLKSARTLPAGRGRDAILARAAIRLAQLGSRAEAIRIAVAIPTGDDRRIALNGISLICAALKPPDVEPLWRQALSALAWRSRSDLLLDLVALTPLIRFVGGTRAMDETVAAVRDTGAWWP
jgi:hypothetical protein